MVSNKKTLVGTVGYHILGNHSLPPMLLPQIRQLSLPKWVKVDELNWGPVAVIQMLQAEMPPFERVVILCAVERRQRTIGTIEIFEWKGGLPDEEQIQACVGDAATGVISVENLLVIGEYFQAWGEEVYLIDVEPGPEVAGEDWTLDMQKSVPDILSVVEEMAVYGHSDHSKIKYLFGDRIFADDELIKP